MKWPLSSLYCIMVLVLLCFTNSYGLGGGPIQPEFSSFEPVDVTDLVNLPTGDFTYTIPLGDVKGPAGVGYPIVLNYHAGIQNEQEASWVGLGWNLNCGSIVRILRGIPDDANGDLVRSYLRMNGEQGWNMEIGGGWKEIHGTVAFSNKGFEGISIGYGYKYGNLNFGANITETNYQQGVGFSLGLANGVNLGVGVYGNSNGDDLTVTTNVGYSGVGFSMSSKGVFNASIMGASFCPQSTSFSKGGIRQWEYDLEGTIPIYTWQIDFGYHRWGWTYSELEYGRVYGYLYSSSGLDRTVKTNNELLPKYMQKQSWTYTTDQVSGLSKSMVTESAPVNSGKEVVDKMEKINIQPKQDGSSFNDNALDLKYAMYSSNDAFIVNAQGLTGTFQAFRNKAFVANVNKNSEIDGIFGEATKNGNIWEIQNSFNTGEESFGKSFNDGLTFKMINEASMNQIDDIGTDFDLQNTTSKKYENIDDQNGRTYGTKIEPLFGLIPGFADRLSGFVVTDLEGKRYYFTQPLRSYEQVAYENKHDAVPHDGVFKKGDNDYAYREEIMPYATTWLLTSITGPDYVKRVINTEEPSVMEQLRPHQGDWGYWVNFRYDYGRPVQMKNGVPEQVMDETDGEGSSAKEPTATYIWRYPYTGNAAKYHTYNNSNSYSATYGKKEITYLQSIETASDIAYFRTSPRLDGIGLEESQFPKFLTEGIPREDVSNVYSSGEDDHWMKQYAWVVPMTTNYTECMQVRLPKNLYPVSDMNFNVGDKIFDLRFTGTIKTRHKILGLFATSKTRTAYKPSDSDHNSALLHVLWDPSGWTTDDQGNPKVATDDPSKIEDYARGFDDKTLHSILYKGRTIDHGYENCPECYSVDANYWTACADQWFEYIFPYAKCYFVREEGDYTVFYIANYDYHYQISPHHFYFHTGLQLAKKYWYTYGGKLWELCRMNDVQYWGGAYLPNSRYVASTGSNTQSLKKLDEIAWYSKTEYPYLDPTSDPGFRDDDEPYETPNDKPFPAPYKRVRFRYNYELAKGTPNSINIETKTLGGGGRLTLKEVVTEAGPEGETTVMPPYLFSYDGLDQNYEGFTNSDKWGYPLTAAEAQEKNYYENNKLGVKWNLKKINLPGCGSIEIELDRDHTKSICSDLVKSYDAYHGDFDDNGSNISILPNNTVYDRAWKNQDLYKVFKLDSYVPGSTEGTISQFYSESGYDIQVGDYFFFFVQVGNSSSLKENAAYLFKITGIDESNGTIKINFNRPFKDYYDIPAGNDPSKWLVCVFNRKNLYCDGIRTSKLISNSITGEKYTTNFEYPTDGGNIEVLPEKAVHYIFNQSSTNGSGPSIRNIYASPFCSDPAFNYNTGNTSVIYPWVKVSNSRNGTTKDGYTKYYFYTIEDSVKVGNSYKPIRPEVKLEEEEGIYTPDPTRKINITTIYDRTNIVGQIKRIDHCNNNGSIITEDKIWKFGEDLPSVHFDALNKTLNSSQKPLGVIEERTIRKDGDDFATSSITDVIRQVPFLVGEKITKHKVESEINYEFADALTGNMMLKEEVGTKSSGESKLTLSIPYRFVCDENKKEYLARKNIFTIQGAQIIAKKVAGDNYSNVQEIINSADKIFSATVDTYSLQNFVFTEEEALPSQCRVFFQGASTWKGLSNGATNLIWPEFNQDYYSNLSQWRRENRIMENDLYGRNKTCMNPNNLKSAYVYLPKLNCISAVIDNASYDGCAAFTCDYDDYVLKVDEQGNISDNGFYDNLNSWEKGQSELSDKCVHFGKKSVLVKKNGTYNYGPTKNIYGIVKTKNYIMSAWICPVSVSTENPICLAVEAWNANGKIGTILVNEEICKDLQTEDNKWQFRKRFIPSSAISGMNPGDYLRISVCSRSSTGDAANAEFYVDDIRFSPDDAMVNTYYYDHQLGIPITFVDPNNHAIYFNYDNFGRLIEKGKVKE